MFPNLSKTLTHVNFQLTQEQREELSKISKSGYGAVGEKFSKDTEKRLVQDREIPGTYAHFLESYKQFSAWREDILELAATKKAEVKSSGKDDCEKGCGEACHDGNCWYFQKGIVPEFWEIISDESG